MLSPLSDNEKPKVVGRRRHLRPEEAAKLITAAGKRGRYPERDKLLTAPSPMGTDCVPARLWDCAGTVSTGMAGL